MLLNNISSEIADKIIGVLQEEKAKLLKSIEDIDLAIAQFNNGKVTTAEVPPLIPALASRFKGSMGWKFKIHKVLSPNVENAIATSVIVNKICQAEPGLNQPVARKSIGSALSQNSTNKENSKNMFLFTTKHGLKYYYSNKDYISTEN